MSYLKGTPLKTFGKTSSTFGGGFVVWDNGTAPLQRYSYGASFTNTLEDGAIVPSGQPVYFNRAAKTVTLWQGFRLNADAADDATEYQVVVADDLPRLEAGDLVMVAPSTQNGTGLVVTVESVDTSNTGYDVVTVDATLGEALSEGDVLTIGAEAGAGKAQAVVATDLIEDNIFVGDGDTNSASGVEVICAVVFGGSIMKDRMPPYPSYLELASVAGQRYIFNPE
jgi:hypothetical protein